jgi:hypothetical protein
LNITKELHEFGTRGEIFYFDRFGQKRSVKVKWWTGRVSCRLTASRDAGAALNSTTRNRT